MDRVKTWRSEFAFNTRDIAYVSVFIAFIAICSWITIPAVVPFTLQLLAIYLVCYVLGPIKGFICILCFLLMGLVGIPVFANFNAGPVAFMGPTGGFLIGFLALPLVYLPFYLCHLRHPFFYFLSMILGLVICYAVGCLWFMFVYAPNKYGLYTALSYTVIPFILPDLVKLVLAFMIGYKIKKYIVK